MLWRLLTMLTPDQWSALGTVVSAVIAGLNLVVVIILLKYTKNATASAQAQAAVAVRTLTELDLEKKLQNSRDLIRAQGRLKDLLDKLRVLEQALQSIRFKPDQWSVKPSDFHETMDISFRAWPGGIPKAADLEQRLRAVEIRLRNLECAPWDNENYHQEKRDLQGFVHDTESLVAEIWKGMMAAAT